MKRGNGLLIRVKGRSGSRIDMKMDHARIVHGRRPEFQSWLIQFLPVKQNWVQELEIRGKQYINHCRQFSKVNIPRCPYYQWLITFSARFETVILPSPKDVMFFSYVRSIACYAPLFFLFLRPAVIGIFSVLHIFWAPVYPPLGTPSLHQHVPNHHSKERGTPINRFFVLSSKHFCFVSVIYINGNLIAFVWMSSWFSLHRVDRSDNINIRAKEQMHSPLLHPQHQLLQQWPRPH